MLILGGYIGVVASYFWDLHLLGDTPEEDFDKTASPEEVAARDHATFAGMVSATTVLVGLLALGVFGLNTAQRLNNNQVAGGP